MKDLNPASLIWVRRIRQPENGETGIVNLNDYCVGSPTIGEMVCCQIVDLDKASFAILLVLSAARRLVLIQIESTIWGKKGTDYSKLGGAGWFSGCLWG